MWAKNEGTLAKRGYNSVRMWAREVRGSLHMQCSDTNVNIPKGMPASIIKRALLEEGAKVSIENHGVDVGTDIIAGRKEKQRNEEPGKTWQQRKQEG